ncbi:hypothetical protein [Marinobacter segnicrescens]|uniref:hypothetical protein n=1 Tax=Marinobacter segnicrescens TaxID=430453 RepID=UPI003A92FA4D
MLAVSRLVFLALLMVTSGTAWAVTLESLLADMTDSAEVRVQEAEQERLAIEHQYRIEERGWSVFGGADVGHFRELQPDGNRDDYTGFGASVGLRYPLLGTLDERERAVNDARLALTEKTYETRLRRSTQRFQLRQSYTDWWHAQAVTQWCEPWRTIAREELASARERARQQALRTSELKWLEQSWDRVTRSCGRSEQYQSQLRERTARLAGAALSVLDQPQRPELTRHPAPLVQWTDALNSHPAVIARLQSMETAARNRDHHWSDRVDSSFTIAQRLDRRTDTAGTGSGLVAGVTFEVPLAALTGPDPGSPDSARYRAARERHRAELDQWRGYLADNLLRYREALDEVSEAVDQLTLARRLTLERRQRLSVDSEAGYMAMRTARIEEAEAHLNLYRAWRGASQERAGLLQVAEHSDNQADLLGSETVTWPTGGGDARESTDPIKAVYVWDSRSLLGEAGPRKLHLRALANNGFNRLYLGLDSDQVTRPSELLKPLEALISEAQSQGIRVDLLLGDPLWLTDEHRADLMVLIQRLSILPFAGLHLDLEVEQLGWPVPEQRLQQWLRTVGEATEVSPWPVTLVSHHRWFSDTADPITCVPCQLPDIGVREVSLMIYTTRTGRSVELMDRSQQLWPRLTFRLVQSVEAALPDSQSWHGQTTKTLSDVEQSLVSEGIHNIEWQDWRNHPAYPGQTGD